MFTVQLEFTHHHLQNPLSFILRAAQIYSDKIALIHTDVTNPVVYTFGIWYRGNLVACGRIMAMTSFVEPGHSASRILHML
jgi:hypothetical protein